MTKKYVIGLDIGGTKIECVLYGFLGPYKDSTDLEKLASQRIPTLRDQGYENVMARIADLIRQVLSGASVKTHQLEGIGAGLPGSIDPHSFKMINGNSQIFIGRAFIDDLAKLTGVSNIKIENDANLFALAETLQGAGRLYAKENACSQNKLVGVGIILGTGCGGGLCLDGKPYSGVHGGGAEIGHSVLKTEGRPCYCGRKGCAEQYLSGSSVEAMFNERKSSEASKLIASDIFAPKDLDKQTLKVATELLREYQHNLSEFLTNLTAFYDPHFFVLGGGVSTINAIYDRLEESLWEKLFVKGARPRVYKHQIGDSAGALGAALLLRPSS